jgi:hypothetical protein
MKKSVLIEALTSGSSTKVSERLQDAMKQELKAVVGKVPAKSKVKKKVAVAPKISFAMVKANWDALVDGLLETCMGCLTHQDLAKEGFDLKAFRAKLYTNPKLVSNVKNRLRLLWEQTLEEVTNDPYSYDVERGLSELQEFDSLCCRILEKRKEARLEQESIQALCNNKHIVLKEENKLPWAEDMLKAFGYEVIRPDGSKV